MARYENEPVPKMAMIDRYACENVQSTTSKDILEELGFKKAQLRYARQLAEQLGMVYGVRKHIPLSLWAGVEDRDNGHADYVFMYETENDGHMSELTVLRNISDAQLKKWLINESVFGEHRVA